METCPLVHQERQVPPLDQQFRWCLVGCSPNESGMLSSQWQGVKSLSPRRAPGNVMGILNRDMGHQGISGSNIY
jgi:hypothetical protein